MSEHLMLSSDEILTTTRAVRKGKDIRVPGSVGLSSLTLHSSATAPITGVSARGERASQARASIHRAVSCLLRPDDTFSS
jgi:hypothetical protein